VLPEHKGDDHARFAALLSVMAKLIRAPEAERRLAEDREAFLAEAGLAAEDLDRLLAAGDKRLLLYRKLVRRGLARAIRSEIHRTAARLGAMFDAEVASFIDEEAPHTHYLRDVGFEFITWAAPRWATSTAIAPYLIELARHELSAFEVASAIGKSGGGLPLELDRAVLFDPAVRLYRYMYAVHRLCEDEDARDEPVNEPTALLAYRDAEHDTRYLELTPLAAAILERLLRGETLRAGVTFGTSDLGQPLDGAVLSSTAALLSDLEGRGVVLGAGGP